MLSRSNKKAKVVIRVDANSNIGLGHFSRCLAISEMIKINYQIVIAIQSPLLYIKKICQDAGIELYELPLNTNYIIDAEFFCAYLSKEDIVVLDGNNFDTAYQKKIKIIQCKLICVDDLHKFHFLADTIINRDPSIREDDYQKEIYTKIYIGFNYSMVNPKFQEAANIKRILADKTTLFICIGGSDPLNITLKAIEAGILTNHFTKINVVTGNNYAWNKELEKFTLHQGNLIKLYSNISSEKMIEVMQDSQVALCPASSIAFEVFCIGLNMVSGYFVEDQKRFASYIDSEKLAISVGDLSKSTIYDLRDSLLTAIESNHYLKQKTIMHGDQHLYINSVFENLDN